MNTIKPSLPSRGAWIEISLIQRKNPPLDKSLPSRGAWIEILRGKFDYSHADGVAPLTGSVD